MILYNPQTNQIAIAEFVYGLYYELEYEDKFVLFASATPFIFGWEKIGRL